jgi:mRNA turnover protein 4
MKYDNTRTSKVRAVRMHFKESWLFMGKNTIAQVALGRTPEDEFQDNLRHISAKLTNNAALFFTSRPRKEVFVHTYI